MHHRSKVLSEHCKGAQLARLRRPALPGVVKSNIAAIEKHRGKAQANRTIQQQIADAITRISGNVGFVLAHVVWFSVWILSNVGLFVPAFDPFPFRLLMTIVSLEAIFLLMFALVSRNRQAAITDRRAQLHLPYK